MTVLSVSRLEDKLFESGELILNRLGSGLGLWIELDC